MKDQPTGSAPPPHHPPDEQRPIAKARAEAEHQAQQIKATSEQEFDQFKQAAGRKTEETKASFQEEARHMAEEAQDAGSKIVERQKQSLISKIRQYEEAIRAAATTLREEQENILAGPAEQAANQLERAAGYLQRHEPGDFLHDLEGVARRRPELVFGGLFVAGFAASRFFKASHRKPRSQAVATTREGSQPTGAAVPSGSDPASATTRPTGSPGGMAPSPPAIGSAPAQPIQPPITHPVP
jgi:hypothetical protein